MMIDVAGRDVLLVDDIFDTVETLERLVQEVKEMGAASVRTAVLAAQAAHPRCRDAT